jgi:hypothetical protein
MEAKDILAAALQAVEEARIPESLQATAFSKAVDLIVAGGEGPHPERPSHYRTEPKDTAVSGSLIDHLATRLKLDRDVVNEVFHEVDGEVRLAVSPSKLSNSSVKAAAQEIALLTAAARQGSEMETTTSQIEVRTIAAEYRKLDSANFASHISEMKNDFQFIGKGKNRQLKVSRPGWERAKQLVYSLGGGED